MPPEQPQGSRVYYHDTDASGLMHHAAYLAHLEEARFGFCLACGVDLGEYARQGIVFPVVHVEIEYMSPLRYGDNFSVCTQVVKVGVSSIHFLQQVRAGLLTAAAAKTVWACVSSSAQASVAVPAKMKEVLCRRSGAGPDHGKERADT